MTILEKIVADKRKEVYLKKKSISINDLETSTFFNKSTYSLTKRLIDSPTGIIAEHKRRSPSKSIINDNLDVGDVARGYENAGVSGMSVLTNDKYFGGNLNDLVVARNNCNLPLLRKDFIVDPFQIIEAKSKGADVILLIAAILTRNEIKHFSELAKKLQLEVLLEVNNEEELHKSIMPSLDMLGVNNRNLKTFEVSLETSKKLSALIPSDFIKVSESGINSTPAIKELRLYGYQGFLIGEQFMKTNDPGNSALSFIKKLDI